MLLQGRVCFFQGSQAHTGTPGDTQWWQIPINGGDTDGVTGDLAAVQQGLWCPAAHVPICRTSLDLPAIPETWEQGEVSQL